MKKSKSTKTLDQEERTLINSIEKGDWEKVFLSPQRRKMLIQAAISTRKDTKMNIRISSEDKIGIIQMAKDEGIPYQTLVCSILHKYRTGHLVARRNSQNSRAA